MIEIGEINDCSEHPEGLRACFFEDPKGNSIELLEHWSNQGNPPPL